MASARWLGNAQLSPAAEAAENARREKAGMLRPGADGRYADGSLPSQGGIPMPRAGLPKGVSMERSAPQTPIGMQTGGPGGAAPSGDREYFEPTAEERAGFLKNNPGDEGRIKEAFSRQRQQVPPSIQGMTPQVAPQAPPPPPQIAPQISPPAPTTQPDPARSHKKEIAGLAGPAIPPMPAPAPSPAMDGINMATGFGGSGAGGSTSSGGAALNLPVPGMTKRLGQRIPPDQLSPLAGISRLY